MSDEGLTDTFPHAVDVCATPGCGHPRSEHYAGEHSCLHMEGDADSCLRFTEPAQSDPATTDERVEAACEVMHDAYERAAIGAGWDTNPASRKPWADVPEANKVTMRAAVSALLGWLERSDV